MTTDFCFYLQSRLIQTSQTGGQQYCDIPPSEFPGYTERHLYKCQKSVVGLSVIMLNVVAPPKLISTLHSDVHGGGEFRPGVSSLDPSNKIIQNIFFLRH
jgi:hypothetical protein